MGIHSRLADGIPVLGGEGDDVIEHVEANWLTAIGLADAEMTHLAEVVRGDVSAQVHDVLTDAPVRVVHKVRGWALARAFYAMTGVRRLVPRCGRTSLSFAGQHKWRRGTAPCYRNKLKVSQLRVVCDGVENGSNAN